MGPLDSERPAAFVTVECEIPKVTGAANSRVVVVLHESADRLAAVQRLELPEKSKFLDSTFAVIPNVLLVAVQEFNNIYELHRDPRGGQLPFLQKLKTHTMAARVSRVAALSRISSGHVGPSSLIGITLDDGTLRVFSWEADRLTPLQIVEGPQNWNPHEMLFLPDRLHLIVTSHRQKPDGGWQSSVEMFRASPAAAPIFRHSQTLVPLESDWDIRTGWISRVSDSGTQIFAFDLNSRTLKQLEFR